MKQFIAFFCCFICLNMANTSFANTTETTEILATYQPQTAIEQQNKEIRFWEQKTLAAPKQFLFQYQLAQAYSQFFELTANIQYLKKAENILADLLTKDLKDPASIQRALAHNYISQHRFKDALPLVMSALTDGSGKRASQFMLFDLYAELGASDAQEQLLPVLASQEDFSYLIRLAKWHDSQGNLDKAIVAMKQAEALAESSKQTGKLNWLYSNLGDYYGHAGKIEWSAAYYQKSLALNPADWYATKGLAWITYSHDNCPEDALAILEKIETQSQDPGIAILKAEILEHLSESAQAEALYAEIATNVSQADYGVMYNAFLCDHYLNRKQNTTKALEIAESEVAQRAVPVAYSLLAQVLYAQNKVEEAQNLSQEYIWHKSFEPSVLLPQLTFFQDKPSEYICEIKAELESARFELGPVQTGQIPAVMCGQWN